MASESTMSNNTDAKAVPLVELLRSVPLDAVLRIDTPNALGCMDTRSIPVGRLCHEAADALSAGAQPAALEPTPDLEAWGACSRMNSALEQIGDYAHQHSTGPAVPDALWEIRRMAYDAIEEATAPHPAPQQPDARDALVRELVEAMGKAEKLLTNLQPHIPQACIPGHAAFIDNYVGPALETLRAALSKVPGATS